MAITNLYIVFPVYKEAEECPHYIKKVDVMSAESYSLCADSIEDIMDFIVSEQYEGFYDGKNVNAFLLPLEIAEEFYPNLRTRFRVVLSRWGENIRTQKLVNERCKYQLFGLDIEDGLLRDIVARKKDCQDGNTALLINQDALICDTDNLSVRYGYKNIEIEVRNAEIKPIANWLEANRTPQRRFHLNPKHGENGKGAFLSNKGEKVSVLMCSKDEAGEFLRKAVGEDLRNLFFYDSTRKQYIQFKREEENVYHGFHLDAIDEGDIPNKVKIKIGKLL